MARAEDGSLVRAHDRRDAGARALPRVRDMNHVDVGGVQDRVVRGMNIDDVVAGLERERGARGMDDRPVATGVAVTGTLTAVRGLTRPTRYRRSHASRVTR